MLVIRFRREGRKKQPSFKIIVTEKKNSPIAGRFVEIVGFYNPQTKEKNLKTDRIKYWLSVGAQPSDTVYNLLVSEKIMDGKKIPKHTKPAVSKEVQQSENKESSNAAVETEDKTEPKKEEESNQAAVSESPAQTEQPKSSEQTEKPA